MFLTKNNTCCQFFGTYIAPTAANLVIEFVIDCWYHSVCLASPVPAPPPLKKRRFTLTWKHLWIPFEQKASVLVLLQVEVGEGEEAVLECGVQGLASIHMVWNISWHILKIFLHIIFLDFLTNIYHLIHIHTNISPHNSWYLSRFFQIFLNMVWMLKNTFSHC